MAVGPSYKNPLFGQYNFDPTNTIWDMSNAKLPPSNALAGAFGGGLGGLFANPLMGFALGTLGASAARPGNSPYIHPLSAGLQGALASGQYGEAKRRTDEMGRRTDVLESQEAREQEKYDREKKIRDQMMAVMQSIAPELALAYQGVSSPTGVSDLKSTGGQTKKSSEQLDGVIDPLSKMKQIDLISAKLAFASMDFATGMAHLRKYYEPEEIYEFVETEPGSGRRLGRHKFFGGIWDIDKDEPAGHLLPHDVKSQQAMNQGFISKQSGSFTEKRVGSDTLPYEVSGVRDLSGNEQITGHAPIVPTGYHVPQGAPADITTGQQITVPGMQNAPSPNTATTPQTATQMPPQSITPSAETSGEMIAANQATGQQQAPLIQKIPGMEESPEIAGRKAMMAQAITEIKSVRAELFDPDGSVDRSLVFQMEFNVPGTDGQWLYSRMRNALNTKLRIETGAQANPSELDDMLKRFMPSSMNNKKTINDKMDRLQQFFEMSLQESDPAMYEKLVKRAALQGTGPVQGQTPSTQPTPAATWSTESGWGS